MKRFELKSIKGITTVVIDDKPVLRGPLQLVTTKFGTYVKARALVCDPAELTKVTRRGRTVFDEFRIGAATIYRQTKDAGSALKAGDWHVGAADVAV